MAISEEEFLAQLLETFSVETKEHTQALINGLIALEATEDPSDRKEMVEMIFREAHSLKGAARAVNQKEVEQLCQAIETIFSKWKRGEEEPQVALFDSIYRSLDLISESIKEQSDSNKKAMLDMIGQLEKNPEKKPVKPKKKEVIKTGSEQTIRVSTGKLDQMLQQVEEMLMVKLAAEQRSSQLVHLKNNFDSFDKQIAKLYKEKRNLKRTIDSSDIPEKERGHFQELLQFLETLSDFSKSYGEQMQLLIRESSQDSRLTANMVDTLLNDTKKMLMQPFSTLFDTFPRMVRDISHSLEKEITLETEGGDIDIDRRILEEMKDPFIHLIRNSIDHGIETKEQRQLLNKDPKGILKIHVLQKSGNQVQIKLIDDGQGIDIEKVKESALSNKLISPNDLPGMSNQDILNLIFSSGISTSSIITDLSGRGLGMGIVAEKVEKLGGNIEVRSIDGEGSTFIIHLPLTLATFRGIHIRAGTNDFIIPTQNILRSFRIHQDEVSTVENKAVIQKDDYSYSFVQLNDLLKLPRENKEDMDYQYILLIRSSEGTIALGVDEVLNEQEVFIKGLGKQLGHIRNISAATILEGGKIIPILDPFDLVKSAIQQNFVVQKKKTTSATEEKSTQTVLLAEDSSTARVLLKNILESAGYNVITAVDGAEAYSLLKTEDVDLLLTDVEMPRMTGFELTEKTREMEKFANLPIIICTSLASREDKERGIEVGANAYIKKSDFTQSQLLNILEQLL